MKKATKLFALVLGMMAIACNKPEIGPEEEIIPEGMIKVTFTASQGTKTSMQSGSDNDGDIYWSAGDAIGVEYDVNGVSKVYEFEINALPAGQTYTENASFTGYVPVGAVAQRAFYPYAGQSASTYYPQDVLTTQPYNASTFGNGILPMVGEFNGETIEFTASAAVVKVPALVNDGDVVLSYGAYNITLTEITSSPADLIFVVDALNQTSFTVDGVVYNTGVKDGELKKVVAGKRYVLHKVAPAAAPEATLSTSEASTVSTGDQSIAENATLTGQITSNTSVSGVTLKTEAGEGINKVLQAATTAGLNLDSVTDVNVHVDVQVTPSNYVAPVAGSTQGSIAFLLTPVATVTAGSQKAENIAVTNDMLDTTLPIVVNIYTGFAPAQIIHKSEGYADDIITPGERMSYNSTTGVTTVKISHFSSLEVYQNEAPAPVGITTQEAFVAACAAAVSGDTITLGAGEFNLNAISVKKGKSLTFVGAGMDNTTLRFGNAFSAGASDNGGVGCYSFDGSGKITIKNVKLQDNYTQSGSTCNSCGFIRAGGMEFDSCNIATSAGSYGTNGYGVTFKNCKFTSSNSNSYCVIAYQGSPFTFDNCYFEGNCKGCMQFFRDENKGVKYNVVINECSFKHGSLTSEKAPVYFYDNTGHGGIWDITVTSCTLDGYSTYWTSSLGSLSGTHESVLTIDGTKVWENGAKVN